MNNTNSTTVALANDVVASRIASIKETRKQEKAIITQLKKQVWDIVDLCGLDEERTARRIQAATRSEYGRINGMINLVAAICKWPAEQGDGASVTDNQALIEKELNVDLMLLEDISMYKGYHTFHTDELEVIDGVEPDYDNYRDYSTIYLQEIGFERVAAEIAPRTWAKKEAATIAKVKEDVTELRAAVERHKSLISE